MQRSSWWFVVASPPVVAVIATLALAVASYDIGIRLASTDNKVALAQERADVAKTKADVSAELTAILAANQIQGHDQEKRTCDAAFKTAKRRASYNEFFANSYARLAKDFASSNPVAAHDFLIGEQFELQLAASNTQTNLPQLCKFNFIDPAKKAAEIRKR
jgi:hypothetical protein